MPRVPASANPRYIFYGYDISYFSGKVEAYLKYRGIDYEWIEATRKILVEQVLPTTGKMKVPVLYDKKLDKWLHDSTSILEYFDRDDQAPGSGPKIIPRNSDVHAFFSFLLEDYADESLWRPALYYRWHYQPDRWTYAMRFRKEFLYDLRAPDFLIHRMVIRRQLAEYVTGDGIRDEPARELTEKMYLETLDVLEAHFQKTPFLLGNLPTLADFGFFASMFRHFSIDPTPSTIMRTRAPAVYEWVARMWNARRLIDGGASFPAVFGSSVGPDDLPESWFALLRHCAKWYMPYLHANAVAFRDGKAEFDFGPEGEKGVYRRLPVVQFRVWCREKLQARFNAIREGPSKERIVAILKETGCYDSFMADGVIPSNLEDADLFPFYRPRQLPQKKTFFGMIAGFEPPPLGSGQSRMPWNEPVYPLKEDDKPSSKL